MFDLLFNRTRRITLVIGSSPLTFIIYYDNDELSEICQGRGNISTSGMTGGAESPCLSLENVSHCWKPATEALYIKFKILIQH